MTGVEKHAHLDRAIEEAVRPYLFSPHKVAAAVADIREAVLVAAREHNTRQAKAISELEAIITECDYWLNGKQTTMGNLGLLRILHEHAVAALRLLRGGEGG